MAGLALTVGACDATSGRQTVVEYVDDTTITIKVKSALFNEPGTESMNIKVTTFQSVVRLSGLVDKNETRARAVELARNTKGVNYVWDSLIVR